MDRWIPLLQTFLHSPTPEADASLWLRQQQQHTHSPAPRSSATDFLSLLTSPAPSLPLPNSLLYIQTLPPTAQSRILSFLAAEHLHFCPHRLRSLATYILLSNAAPASHSVFWVHRAAHHLLDVIPSSLEEDKEDDEHYQELSQEEEEFNALPDWLVAHASAADPILPWLPLPPTQILNPAPRPAAAFTEKSVPMEETKSESPMSYKPEPSVPPPPPRPLDLQARERASALKAQLIASDTASEAVCLSSEIRLLCVGGGAGNELTLLGLIEPWETGDETASILLSHLSGDDGLCSRNWPAHVLCSIALPKLLLLRSTASRTLLSATIGFCKLHQKEAVDALLFPLVLREGGIGVHLCDVLARIIKECLHPAHVSAFCQRLLCWEWEDRNLICQPCHQELIANEVVWTEPLFTLFQHILNHDVRLTPDSVDCLVLVIEEMAGKFSKSLKFGNFLLCFVSKSPRASGFHKLSLMRAAEKTDSFMTKSILAKLADRES